MSGIKIVHDLRAHATEEEKSVSCLVSEFIEYGIKDKKRRAARESILQMIGRVKVNKKAQKMLDQMRAEDDRT